jgi:hypothetical protein
VFVRQLPLLTARPKPFTGDHLASIINAVELDFLQSKREFTKSQQRYNRYRLNKKIKEFLSNELTILQDNGFLTTTVAADCCGVAAADFDLQPA